MGDVAAAVIDIVSKKVRVEGPKPELGPDHRLDELGIESLDAVEMIFDLEEKFGIEIPYNANDTQTELNTVGDVIRAVETLVASKARTA